MELLCYFGQMCCGGYGRLFDLTENQLVTVAITFTLDWQIGGEA